jgi:hypothetical protein
MRSGLSPAALLDVLEAADKEADASSSSSGSSAADQADSPKANSYTVSEQTTSSSVDRRVRKWRKPLLWLDLEMTGLEPETDRQEGERERGRPPA